MSQLTTFFLSSSKEPAHTPLLICISQTSHVYLQTTKYKCSSFEDVNLKRLRFFLFNKAERISLWKNIFSKNNKKIIEAQYFIQSIRLH